MHSRLFRTFTVLTALPAILLMLLLAGCGGSGDSSSDGGGGGGGGTTGGGSTGGSTSGGGTTGGGSAGAYPASGTYAIQVTGTTALGGQFTLPGTLTISPTANTTTGTPNVVDIALDIPQAGGTVNGALTYATNSSLLPNATPADISANAIIGSVTSTGSGGLAIDESAGPQYNQAEFGSSNDGISTFARIVFANATLTFSNQLADVNGSLSVTNTQAPDGSYAYNATFTGTLDSTSSASERARTRR